MYCTVVYTRLAELDWRRRDDRIARSFFTCYHPESHRRVHDVDLWVCRMCLNVKRGDGPWFPVCRYVDGRRLLALDGVELSPDWFVTQARG